MQKDFCHILANNSKIGFYNKFRWLPLANAAQPQIEYLQKSQFRLFGVSAVMR